MRPRSAPFSTVLLLLLLVGACRSMPATRQTGTEPPRLVLPSDWDTCSPVSFERWVLEALPDGSATPVPEALADELASALATPGQRAVRAAAVLGRARSSEASRHLLAYLEARSAFEARGGDAAAVVAAHGLRHASDAGTLVPRLDALAVGALAHPDLEVRVECAATALDLGSTASIPFLLQVLRIGTPAGRADVRDFEAPATSAWARGRAAEALARHAGLRNAYPTDGALAAREAFVAKLERALVANTSPH